MTIPTTGVSWKSGGFGEVDNRFYSRGPLAAVLVRDNRGATTDISPYAAGSPPTVNWTPFAQDGNLRDDLFASFLVDGQWELNPDPNEGFWLIGALEERGGPDRKPSIKHDDAMILQSNFPFETDLTAEGLTIGFTPVEVLKPLLRRLRFNLPLADESGANLVELPGTKGYVLSKPVDAESIDRQIILLFGKNRGGKFIYTAEGYPLLKLTDIGNFRRSKTDADAASLTYTVLPDPFHVDKDPTVTNATELIPALYSEWVAGDGWTAVGGAPVFPSTPYATATAATTAQVMFEEAAGGGGVTGYTLEKYTGSAWTSATVGATHHDRPTTGDATLDVTGLTTGTSYKFRVTATGANTQTGVSAESNTITTP